MRGERATMGKSLLDVQRELRIKAAYVSAIENSDLSVFPNHGFVAGYVRSYARYLQMDPEDVYERFCYESGFEGVNAHMLPREGRRSGGQNPQLGFNDDQLTQSKIGALVAASSSFDIAASLSGLASILVLGGLIAGLGYGGWKVLQEVQRVELTPTAQATPQDETLADFGTPTFSPGAPDTPSVTRTDRLTNLYEPAPQSPPKIDPRDGPIAQIDPNLVGSFPGEPLLEPAIPTENLMIDLALGPRIDRLDETLLNATFARAEEEEQNFIEVVAVQAAWVRVSLANGAKLFEKILEPGEAYRLPEGVEEPLLRAGNAGSVYIRLGGQHYGPLGDGPRVAKNVSLIREDVLDTWSEAALSAKDRAVLQTAVAEAQ
ncbi:MAG: RodZ domain-containing protein [Pseudomonadota bacterium]